MSSVFAPEDVDTQYVEESSYGVTPGSPDMNWIGILHDVAPSIDPSNLKLRGLNRDLSYIIPGLRKADIVVKYVPQFESFQGFMTYGVGQFGKSTSIEYVAERGGTVRSLTFSGCKCNKLSVEIPEEDWVLVTQEWLGQNLAVATSKIGAGYDSDPASDPYSWFDAKVYQDAAEWTNFASVKFDVVNNFARKPVIRETDPELLKYLIEGKRDISGEISAYFENTNELNDILNDTEFDLKVYLSFKYFTFSDVKWDLASITSRMSEIPCVMRLPWTAKGVAMA